MDNASQLWDIQKTTTDGDSKRPHTSALTLLLMIVVVIFFVIPAMGYLVSQL